MYDTSFGRYGVTAISSTKNTNMDVDFTNSFWDPDIQKEYKFDEGDPIMIQSLQSFEANLIIDKNGFFRECLF